MKRNAKKLVSLMLVLCMTFALSLTAFAAYEVSRVNVTINGDSDTARGFCWYTDEEAGTDLQLAPVGEDLTAAAVITGYSYMAMEKYVHKAEADNLIPGTKYAYRVGDSESGVWSETGYFTTFTQNIINLVREVIAVLITYLTKVLPGMIF